MDAIFHIGNTFSSLTLFEKAVSCDTRDLRDSLETGTVEGAVGRSTEVGIESSARKLEKGLWMRY